jgi:NAD-reducing hydrogenase small subunit
MGGIPAMRNTIPLQECFAEAYLNGPTVYNPSASIPNDRELPLLLDRSTPATKWSRWTTICPAAAFGRLPVAGADRAARRQRGGAPYELIKYD